MGVSSGFFKGGIRFFLKRPRLVPRIPGVSCFPAVPPGIPDPSALRRLLAWGRADSNGLPAQQEGRRARICYVALSVSSAMAARLLLTTCPDERTAERIARALVECELAACVTRLPSARSIYRWQGRVEEDAEVQLLVKTTAARQGEAIMKLRELHPYDEPECLVVEVSGGSEGYLRWIEEVVP